MTDDDAVGWAYRIRNVLVTEDLGATVTIVVSHFHAYFLAS
jgi:hypothetical protein